MEFLKSTRVKAAFDFCRMRSHRGSLPQLDLRHGPDQNFESSKELSISFVYKTTVNQNIVADEVHETEESTEFQAQGSYSSVNCAAVNANPTWPNTNICDGRIGNEILPTLDSPKSFKRLSSSSSLSRSYSISSSSHGSTSTLARSFSTETEIALYGLENTNSMSAPTRLETSSFLNVADLQCAGGAAGEDRVQAVCSEENGWLFIGIYDGFNGRDAADFLTVHLYEKISLALSTLEWRLKQQNDPSNSPSPRNYVVQISDHNNFNSSGSCLAVHPDSEDESNLSSNCRNGNVSFESFHSEVLNSLTDALADAESDFLHIVENELHDRPDLAAVGSCVLAMLLHGSELYVLNLGDSRAVLATKVLESNAVRATQLTTTHSTENDVEHEKVVLDHPDDPSSIISGRVKGKLKVTHAFGVNYLKKKRINDALPRWLQVENLCSPPYVYSQPFTQSHSVSENDLFIVLGSDGLFDFFTNTEVVKLVNQFIQEDPFGDPAKHLVEKLVLKAARNAGFSIDELVSIPAGRERRKYHDDVTVIVIILGNKQRMSRASTSL